MSLLRLAKKRLHYAAKFYDQPKLKNLKRGRSNATELAILQQIHRKSQNLPLTQMVL